MKDETQVKDEIILVVKEVIADNTLARDIDDIVELDSNNVDHIAEAVADRLYADGWRKRAEKDDKTDVLEYGNMLYEKGGLMNERDKIIEIVKSIDKAFFEEKVIKGNSIHDNEFAKRIADALIANGIGDVAEWKAKYAEVDKSDTSKEKCIDEQHGEIHYWRDKAKQSEKERDEWKRRAEVAERALEYAVSEYRCDECPCIDCNAEIRGSQECVNLIAKTYKEEAERDIEREIEEEERK